MPRQPDPDVDQRIRRAAVGMLLSRGLDFTMDEVALAAGVGRASVFRRYATKRDLLLEAMRGLTDSSVATPDTGSFRGDLLAIVRETMTAWSAMGPVSLQMYGAAGQDPEVAEIMRTMMRDRLRDDWGIFDRALARGELRPDVDPWLLTDMSVGFITYRGMLRIDFPTPEEVVDVLIAGFGVH